MGSVQVILVSWMALLVICVGIIDQASPRLAPDCAISRLLWPATVFVTGSLLALFGVALAGWGVVATLVDRVT
jgi:hypothetical protein